MDGEYYVVQVIINHVGGETEDKTGQQNFSHLFNELDRALSSYFQTLNTRCYAFVKDIGRTNRNLAMVYWYLRYHMKEQTSRFTHHPR